MVKVFLLPGLGVKLNIRMTFSCVHVVDREKSYFEKEIK